jgi:DNA-binding response OmpR family regulator
MPAAVLLVDSNPDGLEMYLTALSMAGIEAETACSAREALDVFARTRPRAMVTELRLPGTRGVALIEHVRRSQPATFIVGLASEGADDKEARDAGCDVVLSVPCLPDTLIAQLRRGLS